MLPSRFLAHLAVTFVLAQRANAETHTITFVNSCGAGHPRLMLNGNDLLNGSLTYTSNGFYSGIAYLQDGPTHCGDNGENCVLLETTLVNPKQGAEGSGSSTDLSLIQPHKYNQLTSFAYYDGCDGQGKMCSSATCTDEAFFNSNDWVAQVACEVANVNLLVAFCDNATSIVLEHTGGSSPTNSLPVPQSIPISTPSTPVTPKTSLTPTPSTPTTPTPTPTPIHPSDPCQETTPTAPTVPTKTGISHPGGASGSHPATTPSLAPTFTPSSVPSYTHSPSHTPSLTPTFTSSGDACNSDPEPTTPGSKRRRRRRHRRAADQPHF